MTVNKVVIALTDAVAPLFGLMLILTLLIMIVTLIEVVRTALTAGSRKRKAEAEEREHHTKQLEADTKNDEADYFWVLCQKAEQIKDLPLTDQELDWIRGYALKMRSRATQ